MKDCREDDASTVVSDYSSCDESELERYSSANSFLGTSSVCSSLGNHSEYLDFLGSGLVSGDEVDSGNGKEKCLKVSTSRKGEVCEDRNELDSFYAGVNEQTTDDDDGSYREEKFWGSRMKTWTKSIIGFDGNHRKRNHNVRSEKNYMMLSTLSCSSQGEGSVFDTSIQSLEKRNKVKGLFQVFSHDDDSTLLSGNNDEERSSDSGTEECRDNLVNHTDSTVQLLPAKEIAGTQMDDSRLPTDVLEHQAFSLSDSAIMVLTSAKVSSANGHEVHNDQDVRKLIKTGVETDEVKKADADGSFDEMFLDMEEILIDAGESDFVRCGECNYDSQSKHSQKFRHSNLTASTSRSQSGNHIRRQAGAKNEKNYLLFPKSSCSLQAEGSVSSKFCISDKSLEKRKQSHLNNDDSALAFYDNIEERRTNSGKKEITDNLVNDTNKVAKLLSGKEISSTWVVGSARLPTNELEHQKIPLLDGSGADIPSSKVSLASDNDVLDTQSITIMSRNGVTTDEVNKGDVDNSFDEIFLDMEEVLHDSGESHLARHGKYSHGSRGKHSHKFSNDSSTASTSHTVYPLIQYAGKIEWVHVVGAKQRKGDVSLGDRLIGVKEHTVYKLHVKSGNQQWEVERRYRDFFSLYSQLKTLFSGHGLSLPSPWSKVKYESRKFFGNTSPSVINERVILIQDCLSSILNSKAPFGSPSSLLWFLSPSKDASKSNSLNVLVPKTLQRLREDVCEKSSYCEDTYIENGSKLGKKLSLIVDFVPRKSMTQLLEEQHYTCAGCYRFLDTEKRLMQDVARALGWGGPRVCEYSGQVFCSSCHIGDDAVLPAKVLQHWDFSLSPVSQLAKSYLESIYDKPMLCVGAVNPFLFSRVPALLLVMNTRKKIESTLSHIRCAFRILVGRSLGTRRYLLESNDFFALRDLVDLSKGAFAAIPAMIEDVSNKITDHIMQQCYACYDMGVPCAAKRNCRSTSHLIFPFQEPGTIRCLSCGFVLHEICIEHLGGCPCGELVTLDMKESFAASRGRIREFELDGFVDSPEDKPRRKS